MTQLTNSSLSEATDNLMRETEPLAAWGQTVAGFNREGFDVERVEKLYYELLLALGEDPTREGLAGTPRRCAEMWREFVEYDAGNCETAFSSIRADQLVVVKKMKFWSFCEHHLIPFWFEASIGYITKEHVLGLSKFARVCKKHARKLQIQERLSEEILLDIKRLCQTEDVAVYVEGEHLCYDRQTELLTEDGWVRFDALREGVPVAQVSLQTLEMTFAVPSAYTRYPYTGEMRHFKGKSIDLLVTPDHRMVHKPEWEFRVHDAREDWKVAAADKLPPRFYLPQAVVWKGERQETVTLGGQQIAGDDFARFMGAWLSEGCVKLGSNIIVISQNEGAFEQAIWELLQRMPFAFRRTWASKERQHHIQFICSDKRLHAELSEFGKSGDKYVPLIIKQMSVEQIELFLDWYALGDGHRYLHNDLRVQYVSKSARIIDDLQELLVRVGKTGTVQTYEDHSRIEIRTHKQRPGKGYKWYGRILPENTSRVDFSDEVFCVSVPSGALLVRRNGRVAVSGNCMIMRGVETEGVMCNSAISGVFKKEDAARSEFLRLIGK